MSSSRLLLWLVSRLSYLFTCLCAAPGLKCRLEIWRPKRAAPVPVSKKPTPAAIPAAPSQKVEIEEAEEDESDAQVNALYAEAAVTVTGWYLVSPVFGVIHLAPSNIFGCHASQPAFKYLRGAHAPPLADDISLDVLSTGVSVKPIISVRSASRPVSIKRPAHGSDSKGPVTFVKSGQDFELKEGDFVGFGTFFSKCNISCRTFLLPVCSVRRS